MTRTTPQQAADAIAEIEEIAARLRHLEPRLRQRATMSDRDGYPTNSGPSRGNGMQRDPVGVLVALRIDHPTGDTVRHAHTELVTKVDQARRLLEQAESAGHRALPPATNVADDGCVSCSRLSRWSPIFRSRRCRWCAYFSYAHGGEDPPAELLRAHHEGRRISERMVEDWQRRHRHRTP